MKSQKGITLTSLMIYVIGMLIAVSVISVISSYFYKNITGTEGKTDAYKEYTKFNSFFTEDINIKNIKVLECKNEENGNSYIVFSNGTQYQFIKENKGIYKDKVKICKDIDNCTFNSAIYNGKDTITVNFKSGNFTNPEVRFTLGNS